MAFLTLLIGRVDPLYGSENDVEPGELFPRELVEFTPVLDHPAFVAGPSTAWDAALRERGWIERDREGWHLWYTGYDGTREGIRRLGYATSHDGLNWVRASDRPLLENLWVEDMCVVRHGTAWYMFAEGWHDRAQLLISVDRVHWQRVGPLDIRLTSGHPIPPGPFGTPTVWVEGGTWYLFYERRDQGIWLATSTDLRVWTHVQDEPVLRPGPEEYDREMIALNQIVRINDVYYGYYHGSGTPEPPRAWCPAVAASRDLLHWQKFPGNPLRPPDENRSSGLLIELDSGYRFYTLHGQVEVFESH